jgi:hypothetical protein
MTILKTFMMLKRRGSSSIGGLRKPITLRKIPMLARGLHGFLTLLKPFLEINKFGEIQSYHLVDEYSCAEGVDWLATMIVRGCTVPNFAELFERIINSSPRRGMYRNHHMDKNFARAPNDHAAETVLDNGNMFGFPLLHGLRNISKGQILFHFKDFIERINKIERVWKNYFDIRHDNL